MSTSIEKTITDVREARARAAIQEIGLEIAERWAAGFEERPTQQLVLQKIIDPAVRHIMNSIFPWIVGGAILFLVLFICTVITCFIVLRFGFMPVAATTVLAAGFSEVS